MSDKKPQDAPPTPDTHTTADPRPQAGGPWGSRPGYGDGGGGYGAYGSYGGYGAYGQSMDDGEVHLLDYVRIVYRHRWVALTAFSIILISFTLYTFLATPIFESRVQLQIEPENPNIVSFKEVVELDKATNEYYQTQYSILKSRALARRSIDHLNLWKSGELGAGPRSQSFWSRWFSRTDETPAPAAGPDETARQSPVIDAFLRRLTVAPIRNSRLVDLRFQSKDPALAAMAANTVARQYIQQNLEFKFLSSKEASDWLSQQLGEQRKKVEESEQALQRYREKGDAVALEDRQNIVVQRLSDLNAAVTKARTERIEKEALYRQLEAIQHNQSALDTFPAILSNSFIQSIKTQLAEMLRQQVQMSDTLGEKHPDMVKLASAIQSARSSLQVEINKVVQSVRNEYLAAQTQERALASSLEAQKTEALGLNRTGIEYGVLSREAESNRQIYQSLLQRTKETNISGELKTSNVRIVDEAEVPRKPVFPKKSANLLLGLLGGAVAGIGLAFFLEYLDNKIKSPDEIKGFLQIPFLGLIPAIKITEQQGRGVGIPSQFGEAFRVVRTNVLFSSPDEGPRSVVVTSTAPGEGKSLVASNLAMAFAQSGNRVLLVDGDMRKPRVHSIYGLTQEPGLSSLLVGSAKASDAVRTTQTPNLWVLPAGPHPPNPAELLGARRFKDLLGNLNNHFDWVIVDSPPVMAVTDAALIARLVTGVVYVIGSEQTSRYAAREALEQLSATRGRILGAVLNRVDLNRNPYYYSHYYKREYRNYYSSEVSAGH
jgi:polysaccharide biosynthesis transport protein